MRLEQYLLVALATAAQLSRLLAVHAARDDPVKAQRDAIVAANISNGLGWKIFSCLSGSSSRHNLLFSPVSLATTLSILYYGALGNSSAEVRCKISSLLQSPSTSNYCIGHSSQHVALKENKSVLIDKQCYCPPGAYFKALLSTLHTYNTTNATIDVANGIWHHGHLHLLFKRKLKNYFNPKLMTLHPGKPTITASKINEWVSNATRGKISDIINPEAIQENDKVFLFNVLYFRALWHDSFAATNSTKYFITCSACHGNSRLNLTAEESVEEVEYMEKIENVPYCEMPMLTAIRMPYANDNITMTIILPKLCSMRSVEDQLASGNLLRRINNCLVSRSVEITLPKFDLEQELPVNSILSNLGLDIPVDGGFSTVLQQSRNLQLSKVSHQSVLEVNEEGSEAAAVTGITFTAVSFLPEFKANHPFIVLINENSTGAILFMGRVCSPLTDHGMIDITSGPHCDSNSFSGSGQSN